MTGTKVVDLKLVRQEKTDAAQVEMLKEILANRRGNWLAPADDGSPVTLSEMVTLAMDRYQVARDVIRRVALERLPEAARKRERYTAPDPERPWDVAGHDGQTVSEFVEDRLEHIRLRLVANDPYEVMGMLRYTAGRLEDALKREEARQERAERAERQERKRQREREKIEREERRLAREHERARKRIAKGGA